MENTLQLCLSIVRKFLFWTSQTRISSATLDNIDIQICRLKPWN